MPTPPRDITTAPVGSIGSTPPGVLKRLGITVLAVHGVKGVRRGGRNRSRGKKRSR